MLHVAQRLVALELLLRVRADDRDTRASDLSRDEVQQLQRRGVGEMQVFEHEQKRLLVGEPREELGAIPEQTRFAIALAVGIFGVGALGKSRTDCSEPIATSREHVARAGIEPAKDVHHRVGPYGVRHAGLDRVHAADAHRPAIALGALGQRLGEACFADPRLARDDVYAAASRGDVAEPVTEHAELGGSSNVRQRFEAGVPAMRHLLKSGRGPQWRQP